MSDVVFSYAYIQYAQDLFRIIQKHYQEFDWTASDADWKKNGKALQKCIRDYEKSHELFPVRLVYTEWGDGDWHWDFVYYEKRLRTRVHCGYEDGSEHSFDFGCPLDILALLDSMIERAEEMKNFYQIKTA